MWAVHALVAGRVGIAGSQLNCPVLVHSWVIMHAHLVYSVAILSYLSAAAVVACAIPAVDGVKFVVVDMTPVTRSDSSGAHFIYDLAKDLRAKGIQLVLCDPTDTVSSTYGGGHGARCFALSLWLF